MKLFEEINHRVTVAPEALTIPEFKKLLTRDRTKLKEQAVEDLAFVYHMCDYRSPYAVYPSDSRRSEIIKGQKLRKSFKMDAEIKKAMARYVEFSTTPTLRSLVAIKDGLLTSAQVIESLSSKIKSAIEYLDEDYEHSDDEEAVDVDISTLVKQVELLLSLSDKLPKAIDTISDLEEKVKKESSTESQVRGGGVVGDFEG